ncbi:MAG: chemotaxis-specific protein-glutamate methyltransferase CheB [Acidobacteriota bacterium]
MVDIIRVLVVDDSAYVRKVVREMLSQSPFIEVVGAARNGVEALEMVESLRPDVVTSDLVMPELDGVGFVREQMRRRAVPIVMMSSLNEGGLEALAALEAGAVDFVQKPTALASEKMFQVRGRLIETIKTAAMIDPQRLLITPAADEIVGTVQAAPSTQSDKFDAVVIGISTGGPQALRFLIPQLPAVFPVPIAIVLHMPVGYTAMYAERLDEISKLAVIEAGEGSHFQPGTVLLAPAGKHLYLKRRDGGEVAATLSMRPPDTPHRPAVDVLFRSAAEVFGGRTLGIVMTGMGTDGRAGATRIKETGGVVFAESEESCVVFGMPGAVVEAGLADRVVKLNDMARVLLEAV